MRRSCLGQRQDALVRVPQLHKYCREKSRACLVGHGRQCSATISDLTHGGIETAAAAFIVEHEYMIHPRQRPSAWDTRTNAIRGSPRISLAGNFTRERPSSSAQSTLHTTLLSILFACPLRSVVAGKETESATLLPARRDYCPRKPRTIP